MRLALKAAAAADQKLRQLPLAEADSGEGMSMPAAQDRGQPRFSSYEESQNFADSVAAIDSGNFKQAMFKSSRAGKPQETMTFDLGPSHDDAIFGSLAVTGFTIKPDPDTKPLDLNPETIMHPSVSVTLYLLSVFNLETIMHPSLFCDPEDKLDQWIERLTQLRKRKLEGDAL
ncbi:serine/Arginine-related protein 53-like [Elysia marginata]|uniref:Serine/Arginine-related protein 53-like n=1 Tax=Elysia marginata TaxID=1093978 RepID=A0AAV4FUQ1_9GAST|nr:serine/Arginine-related protein 53-like [Elysia marginata]